MPDDRYSDWERVEFCKGCGTCLDNSGVKADIEKQSSPEKTCPMCDEFITTSEDRIVGRFSPVAALRIRRFV